MSATDDFRKLLDELDSKLSASNASEARLKAFEDGIISMSVTLQDIAGIMEKPDDDTAIIDAINRISIPAPEVRVDSPVNVTVQPAQVVIMPSAETEAKGWKLLVTMRDGNGAIREISMRPE